MQANLILTEHDNKEEIRRWQEHLKAHGVWVSEPVPMFPFRDRRSTRNSSDRLTTRPGNARITITPGRFPTRDFSDIQEQKPVAIEDLECAC